MRLSRAAAASSAALALAGGLAATSLAASGIIETVAGTGSAGYVATGLATSAELNRPTDVAAASDGGFFIADSVNDKIRRVTPAGEIASLADGTGGEEDGDASALNAPVGVAQTPAGDVLVADQNRVVLIARGVVTTVAGNGSAGGGGDNGPATSAQLRSPAGIAALPAGGFVVADMGNDRIRKVSAEGTITTVAGDGSAGFSGDGSAATSAQLRSPTDVAVLADGDLLIADTGNGRVRRLDDATGIISTVAGGGSAVADGGAATDAALGQPRSVVPAADGGFVVSEAGAHRVRRVLPDGTITTVAGTGNSGDSGDGGAGTAAQLRQPSGLAVPTSGRLLIADRDNHKVRSLDIDLLAVPPASPEEPSTTVTGEAPAPSDAAPTGPASSDTAAAQPPASAETPAPAAATSRVAPKLGTAVGVAPVSGIVYVRRPGAAVPTPLAAGETIPVGSLIDTRRGTVAGSRRARGRAG